MGLFEQLKGRAKQAAGDMTDNPDLRREGVAQEEKGQEASREEHALHEAQQHERAAREHERRQEAAERR